MLGKIFFVCISYKLKTHVTSISYVRAHIYNQNKNEALYLLNNNETRQLKMSFQLFLLLTEKTAEEEEN